MKNFEKISKMNLADLDRPEGIIEEESIQDADLCVEKTAQNPEDGERSETIVTENVQEQPEELAKKEMMEPQGRHFRVDEFHYMFDEWRLHLELGDDAIDVEWKKVTKLIFYKSVAVIYTGKNNAFLIPSAAMGTQREEIMNFIKEMKKR